MQPQKKEGGEKEYRFPDGDVIIPLPGRRYLYGLLEPSLKTTILRITVFKTDYGGRIKRDGRDTILGIARSAEVIRRGLLRRTIASLRYDPVSKSLFLKDE